MQGMTVFILIQRDSNSGLKRDGGYSVRTSYMPVGIGGLGEMETTSAFTHCNRQLLLHDRPRAVRGQLEVVRARHHARQVVVW